MSSIAELLEEAEAAVRSAGDLAALDAVRVRYLGKKGSFTAQLRELGKLLASTLLAQGRVAHPFSSATTPRRPS